MKKSVCTAIFALTAMMFSSFATPCLAQVTESQIDGKATEEDVVFICEEADEDLTFITEETQPEFPGGMQALMEYVKNELHYPKKCRKAKIEGRSFVKYTIEEDGRVTDVEISKSCGNKLLDKEAVRVIKKMPRWMPGTPCQ